MVQFQYLVVELCMRFRLQIWSEPRLMWSRNRTANWLSLTLTIGYPKTIAMPLGNWHGVPKHCMGGTGSNMW